MASEYERYCYQIIANCYYPLNTSILLSSNALHELMPSKQVHKRAAWNFASYGTRTVTLLLRQAVRASPPPSPAINKGDTSVRLINSSRLQLDTLFRKTNKC